MTNQDSPNTAGAEELKACPVPWCERKDREIVEYPDYKWQDRYYRVECGCGCKTPRCMTEAEAIAAWNTRPENPPQRPSVVPDEVVERIVLSFSDKAILRLDIDEDDRRLSIICDEMRSYVRAALSAIPADPVPGERKFNLGDRVTKTKGSSWTGYVVGFYSTSLTKVGYAVESENEPGSVQIYPESALAAYRGK